MGFDGEGFSSEGRTVSHVGHRVEAFPAYARAANVNTVPGDELLIPAQVNGGDGVPCAISTAPPRRRQDTERACQQVACSADPSFVKQFADLRARHWFSPQPQFRIDLHLETHFTAILREQVDVARC